MLSSRFVVLDRFPLTAGGKFDRHALPHPPAGGRDPDHTERPMTAVEEAVADLWRLALAMETVGPDDDFFEIGGHSLHAMRLLAAVRRAFRIELPMSALFEATTVAGLARALLANEPEPGHIERAARAVAKLRALSVEVERAAPDRPGTPEAAP